MVRQLTSEDYAKFVKEKRAAAVHFDAEWDAGYRRITRQKMQEAEQVLGGEVNFGEIDVDRDIPLAKEIRLHGVPAVAYYVEGQLVALLPGIRQNIQGRLERVLRGEPIGPDDGMDGY